MPNFFKSLLGVVAGTHDMPGQGVVDIVPSDSEVIRMSSGENNGNPAIIRRLCVGTGGDVKVRSAVDGSIATFVVPDGGVVDGYFDMVYDAGTDAEDIVGQT